jgi:hypothetical protein
MLLGLASSVAKEFNWSWAETVRMCRETGAGAVQFYLSGEQDIPDIPTGIKKIYLHLAPDFDYASHYELLSRVCTQLPLNGLIIHRVDPVFSRIPDLISLSRIAPVFVENHSGSTPSVLKQELVSLGSEGLRINPVIDVHRFFNNFHPHFTRAQILTEIFALLEWAWGSGRKIVLHIIDSHRFDSDRSEWCVTGDGIIPYVELFQFIAVKNIEIEAAILEYESIQFLNNSLKNIQCFPNTRR